MEKIIEFIKGLSFGELILLLIIVLLGWWVIKKFLKLIFYGLILAIGLISEAKNRDQVKKVNSKVLVEGDCLVIDAGKFKGMVWADGNCKARGNGRFQIEGLWKGLIPFIDRVFAGGVEFKDWVELKENPDDTGLEGISLKSKGFDILVNDWFIDLSNQKVNLNLRTTDSKARIYNLAFLSGHNGYREEVRSWIYELVKKHKITVPAEQIKCEVYGDEFLVKTAEGAPILEVNPRESKFHFLFLASSRLDATKIYEWLNNILKNYQHYDAKIYGTAKLLEIGNITIKCTPEGTLEDWKYEDDKILITKTSHKIQIASKNTKNLLLTSRAEKQNIRKQIQQINRTIAEISQKSLLRANICTKPSKNY